MAAIIGLDDNKVESACHRIDDDVWVANYNAPGQVVIAGSPEAVAAAGDVAKELGAKRAMPLPVSGAFHTPFMGPARDRLRKAIDQTDFRDPDHPVYANVDAIGHGSAADWPALLSSPAHQPGALAPDAERAGEPGLHHLRRAGTGHGADGHGQAHCQRCRRT